MGFMLRLIQFILSICLMVGIGDAMVRLTLAMCRAAIHAHQHDQMSYSKFTRALVGPQRHSPAPAPGPQN